MDRQVREAIRRLQEVGSRDLRLAHVCLSLEPPMPDMAAFHAQQGAEKHLKAWLVALGDPEPPLTHNLSRLYELLLARGAPPLPEKALAFLTRFGIAPRYALTDVSMDEAQRAVEEANRIVETARQAVAALLNEPKTSRT